MSLLPTVRTVLTPRSIAQLALGWAAVVVLLVAPPEGPLPGAALLVVLGLVVAVVVVCAFGVVTQAERLAHRLGDPYGTLVLTLSIVVIEVILISAVMLGPGEHATIARDSVTAVAMIILNLVVGVALVVGARRHRLVPNRAGVSAYLVMMVVLLTTALALPGVLGTSGGYAPALAVPILVLTLVLYGLFLARQLGPRRRDFQEVGADAPAGDHGRSPVLAVLATHRPEVIARTAVLVLTVLPIVLLSHDMATLLDDGLARLGAPVALSGLLIAMIVFLPETITTIRAALTGEIQRVSNLTHGALVSTVGLTIPAVLTIGLVTGQQVVLAEGPVNLVLLGVSLLLTMLSFGRRATALHGAAHLAVFALYLLVLLT